MANIHSQKKRILRSERERLENRHYTSAVRTYFRRLEAAVAAGDDATADTEHRELVSLIDKSVKRGAMHATPAPARSPVPPAFAAAAPRPDPPHPVVPFAARRPRVGAPRAASGLRDRARTARDRWMSRHAPERLGTPVP